MKTITIVALIVLLLVGKGLTHPIIDEMKRSIPRLHAMYLTGLTEGIKTAGGASARDWDIINLLIDSQRAARADLNRMAKEILDKSEEITQFTEIDLDWVIETYADLLKKRGFDCNHLLWTDTRTRDFCLGLK